MKALRERRQRSAVSVRRLAPRIVAAGALVVLLAPGASAAPIVQEHLRARRHLEHELARIGHARTHHVRGLLAERRQLVQRLDALASRSVIRGRWQPAHRHIRHAIHMTDVRLAHFRSYSERIRHGLIARRVALDAWIAEWGTFRRCPVAGSNDVADNFGITVRLPGVPVHRHMGNDIAAAAGTPIVAPFGGYATSGYSPLGGLEVRVRGDAGYVYNAHLSSLGHLGYVGTGEVIGYVGVTGDATAAHDHFEWHPYDGAAIDPNPLLSLVC